MTTTNNAHLRKQQIQRMIELGNIARQRYLDAGGNPRLSVGTLNNNDTLTDKERQEFFELGKQVVSDEDIADYLKKHGTVQERYQKFLADYRQKTKGEQQ